MPNKLSTTKILKAGCNISIPLPWANDNRLKPDGKPMDPAAEWLFNEHRRRQMER